MNFNKKAFKKELLEYTDDPKVIKFIKSMSEYDLDEFVTSYMLNLDKFYNNHNDSAYMLIAYFTHIVNYDLFDDLLEFIEKIMEYYKDAI